MTRRARRLRVGLPILLVALVTVVVPAPSAHSAPVIIDFEDQVPNTAVANNYAGVTFGNAVARSGVSSFTKSGVIYVSPTCPPSTAGCVGLTASFSPLVWRVRVWVGATSSPNSGSITLSTFDSSGGAQGSARFDLSSSSGPTRIEHPLEVVARSNTNSIATARITWTNVSAGEVAVDDFEFERLQADLSITPNPVDFGSAIVGGASVRRTATITSTGNIDAAVGTMSISGADAGDFSIATDGCSGRTLKPGTNCAVEIDFVAGALGSRTALLTNNNRSIPRFTRLVGTGATTTTTEGTTTTEPTVSDTTTTTRRGTIVTTTTTTIPPPTAGATLIVNPAVGPTGLVTEARGTGFPPGPVALTWSRGIGAGEAIAGADGTFVTSMLLFPRDLLGPRQLVATGGTTTAVADFLVVPSSVQPSGRDVIQITNARRLVQR